MLLLIPYQVDVPMARWPIANFILIPAIAVVSLAARMGALGPGLAAFILHGWNPTGLLGHMLLHGGLLHLVGNMVFLWVFGNAVCAKVGNLAYPAVFLGLGLLAAAAHNLMDGSPAIGASGAINGVVGFYLVLYPLNNINCMYLFLIRPGQFAVSSVWMILLWLAFDIWGAASGGAGVAYWAHLGGFVAGVGLASALLRAGLISMSRNERSLWQTLRD